MSSKSTKKLSVPRELPEIEQEHGQQCYQAGALQYQMAILSDELNNINDRLRSINREAAARKQLNEQKAKVENG